MRALLLQAFYSVRSERQLMEQLDCNLLFRWFVGLSMDAPVWDASTFCKNRERFLGGDVAQQLLTAVLDQPRVRALMSDEHFLIDGILIQAWASHKSFRPKPPATPDGPAAPDNKEGRLPGPVAPAEAAPVTGGRNQEQDWRGQKRSNETHASTTDGDARLAQTSSGQASLLAYAAHVLMENRTGLVSHACRTHATGTAERDAALTLVGRLRDGKTRVSRSSVQSSSRTARRSGSHNRQQPLGIALKRRQRFRRAWRSVGRPMPAASKPPSTAISWPVT